MSDDIQTRQGREAFIRLSDAVGLADAAKIVADLRAELDRRDHQETLIALDDKIAKVCANLAVVSDQRVDLDAIRLRFFRDLVEYDRYQIFRGFGIDEDVIAETHDHSDEVRIFNHLFACPSLTTAGQAVADGERHIDYRYLNLDTLEFVGSQGQLIKQIGEGGIIKSFCCYPDGFFVAASQSDFTETDANLACKKAHPAAPAPEAPTKESK